MESQWIDTYAHFSVLGKQVSQIEAKVPFLKRVKDLYSSYQEKFNAPTHLMSLDVSHPLMKWPTALIFGSNLPFSALQTEDDLLKSMEKNGVKKAIVGNLEPFTSHLDYLNVCEKYENLYSLVNFARDENELPEKAHTAYARGAVGFVIHPILEETDPASEEYFPLAELADNLGVPLVCRTGITHYPGNPCSDFGEINRFRPLLEQFPNLTFVMTHSNLSKFEDAIAFAKEYENVVLDTVWQNVFSVKQILKELGPDRVIMGSDWPVLGDQQAVQKRILTSLKLPTHQLEKLTYQNAERIYKIASK